MNANYLDAPGVPGNSVSWEEYKSEKTRRLKAAADELDGCPLIDAAYRDGGYEHFHPDVGEYMMPDRVKVEGDMGDPATLKVMSRVMDKHGLKVHTKHGGAVTFSDDESARLVVGVNRD